MTKEENLVQCDEILYGIAEVKKNGQVHFKVPGPQQPIDVIIYNSRHMTAYCLGSRLPRNRVKLNGGSKKRTRNEKHQKKTTESNRKQ